MLLMRLFVAFLLLLAGTVESARILSIFPTPARSHSRVFESLLHELATRGHHVTFASPVPLQLPPPSNASGGSLNAVLLDHGRLLETSHDGGIVGPNRRAISESLNLWQLAPALCEHELATPELQPFIKDKSIKIDLVITEVFFFDCMIPFAHHFGAPLITITSQWAPPWAHAQVGNPDMPAVSPNMFLHYGDKMNLWERTHNALFTGLLLAARHWLYLPRQDAVVRRVFGNSTPALSQLEHETSLLLTNTDPLLNFPHANLPAVVEVGGLHIQPVQPLPQDLARFLDEAKEDVVLFSLGSMISSATLPTSRLHLLTEAMAALPCAVLWRWDIADVPDLPTNVRVETWIPQRDVLAHPNVRLLVTHGGLLSGQEAALEGVPRLVLPFFGDQRMNAFRAVDTGVAIALNFYSAKPGQLATAAKEILTEPKYRESAQRLAKALRDQPQTPLERGVFWTEYVIRHKGAPHLRSAALDLAWYQLYLLDVAAAILVTLLVTVLLFCLVMKRCCQLLSKSSNQSHSKEE